MKERVVPVPAFLFFFPIEFPAPHQLRFPTLSLHLSVRILLFLFSPFCLFPGLSFPKITQDEGGELFFSLPTNGLQDLTKTFSGRSPNRRSLTNPT